jgi:hypothetical protein
MKTNLIAFILLALFILSILFSVTGIISISFSVIVSYLLLIGGMVLVYNAILKENKIETFIGAVFFLSGVFFLVSENFDVRISNLLILSILFLIAGTGFFMIFILDTQKRMYVYVSVALIAGGLIIISSGSQFKPGILLPSLVPIVNHIWPALLILILILILMKKD